MLAYWFLVSMIAYGLCFALCVWWNRERMLLVVAAAIALAFGLARPAHAQTAPTLSHQIGIALDSISWAKVNGKITPQFASGVGVPYELVLTWAHAPNVHLAIPFIGGATLGGTSAAFALTTGLLVSYQQSGGVAVGIGPGVRLLNVGSSVGGVLADPSLSDLSLLFTCTYPLPGG